MPDLGTARSLLFVPGNDERKLAKALASQADAVIADLEDSVPADEKEAARELVVGVVTGAQTRVATMVRINGFETPFGQGDWAAVSGLGLAAVVLPKAEPAALGALEGEGPPIVAIVETAAGVRCAFEVASSRRVAALALGGADLGLELGLERRADGQELLFARSKLVVDSAAAGLRRPFDVVHVDVRDRHGLIAECRLARSLGFGGKLCVHPGQVAAVNEAFSPSAEQLDWAARVVDAYEEATRQGRGAVALDGEMIDLPVVERARSLLAEAGRRADGA